MRYQKYERASKELLHVSSESLLGYSPIHACNMTLKDGTYEWFEGKWISIREEERKTDSLIENENNSMVQACFRLLTIHYSKDTKDWKRINERLNSLGWFVNSENKLEKIIAHS